MAAELTSVGTQTDYRFRVEVTASGTEAAFSAQHFNFKYSPTYKKNFEFVKEVIGTLPFTLRFLVRREYPMYNFSRDVFFGKVNEGFDGVPSEYTIGIFVLLDKLREDMDKQQQDQIAGRMSLAASVRKARLTCQRFDDVYFSLVVCLGPVHEHITEGGQPDKVQVFRDDSHPGTQRISFLFKVIRGW